MISCRMNLRCNSFGFLPRGHSGRVKLPHRPAQYATNSTCRRAVFRVLNRFSQVLDKSSAKSRWLCTGTSVAQDPPSPSSELSGSRIGRRHGEQKIPSGSAVACQQTCNDARNAAPAVCPRQAVSAMCDAPPFTLEWKSARTLMVNRTKLARREHNSLTTRSSIHRRWLELDALRQAVHQFQLRFLCRARDQGNVRHGAW